MTLDREWEKFRGGPTPFFRDRLHVTLAERGVIFINKNLYRLWGKPPAVYLYFNRPKDQIALEPTSPRLPEAFGVTEKCNGYMIHASPFCRHFGIRLEATHKFVRPELTPDGKLLLDLSNTVIVTRVRTGKRR